MPLALCFVLRIVLGIRVFFVALYEFQDCFFCFYEKCHWNCDRDGTDSIDGLR